jgi:hypothetical protein
MVVSEGENNKQTDADILQSKADILRARDIIPGTPPPHKKKTNQKPESQKTGENTIQSAVAAEISTQKEKAEIPRFDLAEEIMAEQRKITAVKRKAPGKKTEVERLEPQAQPVGYTTIEQPAPTLPEQDRIIAEIVARDIERLCRGNTSGTRG